MKLKKNQVDISTKKTISKKLHQQHKQNQSQQIQQQKVGLIYEKNMEQV
jgi:hypothetical protein